MKWRVGLLAVLALFVMQSPVGPFSGTALADEKAVTVNVEREIQKRKVVGSNVVRVKQDQTVALSWQTDETVELHLHGYDIELTVKSDAKGTMRFKAHATGRYPVTAHGFGDHHHGGGHKEKTLLYIEVHPN